MIEDLVFPFLPPTRCLGAKHRERYATYHAPRAIPKSVHTSSERNGKRLGRQATSTAEGLRLYPQRGPELPTPATHGDDVWAARTGVERDSELMHRTVATELLQVFTAWL